MKKILCIVLLTLVACLCSCTTKVKYTEMLDIDGKTVISRTTEYEADKLKDKGVAFGGTVEGLDVECDISMGSGSPTPLPKTKFGWFNFFWIDCPLQTGGVYYSWVKSLWSDSPASVTYIRFGSLQKASEIKFSKKPSNLIDVPMFSVVNPFAPEGDFQMDIVPTEPAPILPPLLITPPNTINVDTGISVDTDKK